MLQNLRGVRTLCLIFWGINAAIRLMLSLFPDTITRAQNFPEFNMYNWTHTLISPVFFIVIHLLLHEYRKTRKATKLMSLVTVVFSFYIILSGLISSFTVTYIPSDNLVTFMIGLTVVGVVCVFEYAETWLITMLTAVVFMALLIVLTRHDTEILYNMLICAILLTGFYFISRYNYSYRANHFLQLVEINQKNMEIERASNFKTEVLGMVAHDLRNPIAAVESIAMLMELDSHDEDTQENIGMVKQSCVKARGIIDDLIEVAKNENTQAFDTEKAEFNHLLKDIVNTWRSANKISNKLTFTSHYNPVYAMVNVVKFQRVMDNLISNAAKFSRENSPIEIDLTKTNKFVLVEVRDHGLGIAEEMLPKIFDRFSKAGRQGLRGEESTGLGLSIVQQIIERHNGKIEVKSKVNEGSLFRVFLPLAEI
ncbi:MAG: HAMP domain-containing histidine kinase [Sphingobacteriaceae bacterium]|nr:MAG: HAMP domain-containing histidine kinase [Sphingobacteriaceae bacterium]